MKPYRETYNDGFINYGRKSTTRTSTGKRIGETFESIGTLAFKEISCRDSDFQMAGLKGASLDLKIKTPFPPSFRDLNKNKLTVILRGYEYDVINVDYDQMKTSLFFYLQRVGVSNE
ncbi:phage head closure protein [Cytobacillus spongiae]|uniref:phage head closure protein n=1 Tax=Cytobacillus spongiae TaxID=2901381 RepID=UPI001F3D87BD|nr:phage head closure protein [Cytobacillus spongiae]UII56710.1 phage head closure protein [Cytobacillus spongiae]